jgi:aryl-alcohol dehydrogenase-like predicted oxidoreductase
MRWDLAKGDFGFKSKNNDGKEIDIYKYAGKESVIYECEQSLKRLGTDYIDLYQIHWPDVTTPISETFEAVSRLIEQGKVRYAGVCNYNVAQVKEADQTLEIISNQIPFSMVNRGVEEETVPYCIEKNKSILAYSPMERGLLTGKMKPGHQFEAGDHRQGNKFFSPESIEKTNAFLAKIKPLADEKNATLSQLVLRWTVEQPGITIVLAGARNEKQAVQNAEAIHVKLNAEEIQLIDNELENAGF